MKNPADFIGSVIGESEKNTKDILANTVGKVLIIDEVSDREQVTLTPLLICRRPTCCMPEAVPEIRVTLTRQQSSTRSSLRCKVFPVKIDVCSYWDIRIRLSRCSR
jgi:hypothetical protein